MLLPRFHQRSFYTAMKKPRPRCVGCLHEAIHDLLVWLFLASQMGTRLTRRPNPNMTLHSNASTEVGNGGILTYD